MANIDFSGCDRKQLAHAENAIGSLEPYFLNIKKLNLKA
jgi:hypothetical protein